MLKLRSGLLGFTLTSALALCFATANAADIYRPEGGLKDGPVYAPVNSWAGFYIGANGGFGWSANGDQNVNVFLAPPFPNALVGTGSRSPDPSGGFGGAQAGYNWQRGHIVFGVESDIQVSDISDDKHSIGQSVVGPLNARFTEDLDWFGTARGRVGYAWDRTLLYFTGGFAFGKISESRVTSVNIGIPFEVSRLGRSDVETGYVLGGGIEFKPGWGFLRSPNWSVKAEYQYINLGSDNLKGTAFGFIPLRTNDIDNNFHTVRIGLNYHINRDYEPLK